MNARGLVHHIDLTVSDLARSRPFYDSVLGFMGYARSDDHANGTDWDWQGEGPFHSIGILLARGDNAARLHDRYSPGLHHLAWTASDPADVDRLHALLLEIGATVLDPPAFYPRYGPDYYAVFFADPDGLKLEFVSGRTG
ncbi:VOC family protein [Altererythrobacter sp. CC-YST694]|uniref:VOC family protein n=1 Tax=Altererythrobacter sp. CC-YST694 TaxID=2755038 RepID=UPI001D00D379|nr:VOC family protein [Altererythrobacter sp. CC-YST694]MCB5425510.1 VOC family protein [Altererythrobacter sp. CC-YST694]